jgi:hypothetical protein
MRELFLRLWDRLPLQFRVLHRQFLLRVIDLEALSIEADIPRFLGQFAGILIMISLLKCLGTLWFPPPPSMALVVEHGQIENMLLVIGLIVVLTWDATFPDRRDVMVLAPLPVKARTILLARIAASATLLGIAIAALNFASSFSYALVFGRSTVRFFIAYWFTMTAGAALIYGSVLTMQGITALLLPRRMYLRLSAILQLAAYVLVLATYFLPGVSLWGDIAQPRNHWMAWAPSIWLLALLNQLNGSLPPEAAWLAWRGWMALGAAVAGAFAALAMCYLRTMKKTVEEPDLVPGAGGFHWAPRLGGSLQSAILLFCLRSITRSRQHRVALAFYWSLVFAIGLAWLRRDVSTPPEPITLDLLMPSYLMMSFAVLGLRGVFSLPISLNANWVLRLTQLRPTEKYLGATRSAMLLFGAVPVWLTCAALSLHFRPWQQVAEHLLFLALLGCVLVELSLIRFDKVPFTCSYLPGKTNMQVLFWGFALVSLIFAFLLATYEEIALKSLGSFIALTITAVGAIVALRVVNSVHARSAELYFEEVQPEIITSLGLMFIPQEELPAAEILAAPEKLRKS